MNLKYCTRKLIEYFDSFKDLRGCEYTTRDYGDMSVVEITSTNSNMLRLLGDDLIYSTFTGAITKSGKASLEVYFAPDRGRAIEQELRKFKDFLDYNKNAFSYYSVTYKTYDTDASIYLEVDNVTDNNITSKLDLLFEAFSYLCKYINYHI